MNLNITGFTKIENSETIYSDISGATSRYISDTCSEEVITSPDSDMYSRDEMLSILRRQIIYCKPEWKPSYIERLLNQVRKYVRIATYTNSPSFLGND